MFNLGGPDASSQDPWVAIGKIARFPGTHRHWRFIRLRPGKAALPGSILLPFPAFAFGQQ